MLQDLIVLAFVLVLACAPVLYGFRLSQKRIDVHAARGRLARRFTRDKQTLVVKQKLMGPNKSWVEAQNDVRRRRLSIPRVKSHL